jgi:hypothetical protein
MSCAKLAVVSSLTAVALAGCGAISVKPASPIGSAGSVSRGMLDDPRTTKNNHLQCLLSANLTVRKVGATGLQIGPPSVGPTVVWTPSPGAAQFAQIEGRAPGAEVIGGALVYPNQASDSELALVENCVAKGVSG